MSEKPIHYRVWEALNGLDLDSTGAWVNHEEIPRYDTSWDATGPLIERFRLHGEMRLDPTCHKPRWCAFFIPTDDTDIVESGPKNTLPLAVCHLILALAQAGKLEAK